MFDVKITFFDGVPRFATYIFQIEPELGAGIDSGMDFTIYLLKFKIVNGDR
jgi:hypothetical protein